MKRLFSGDKVHFIGIGGISMSALAQYLYVSGYTVSGSDIVESARLNRLKEQGIDISIGHDTSLVSQCDLCVYTAAVAADDIEVAYCLEHHIKLLRREQLLSEVLNSYKYSIAVSGSHGKTTTTGMIFNALNYCSVSSTLFVGGDIKGVGNFKLSQGDYAVYEACEYKRSFLSFDPHIAVILNVECDHMDYYKDIADVADAFNSFAKRIKAGGKVVVCEDAAQYIKIDKSNVFTFGFSNLSDLYATNVQQSYGRYYFDVALRGKKLGSVRLKLIGKHNVYNALATISVGVILGLDFATIAQSISKYEGVTRRFESVPSKLCSVICDYAHHPTEIKAVISSAKLLGYKNVVVAFQPHTYTRTKAFFNDFVQSLNIADKVILLPIYAAREKDIYGVSSKDINRQINELSFGKSLYAQDFTQAIDLIKKTVSNRDLLIIMGAGDIDSLRNNV